MQAQNTIGKKTNNDILAAVANLAAVLKKFIKLSRLPQLVLPLVEFRILQEHAVRFHDTNYEAGQTVEYTQPDQVADEKGRYRPDRNMPDPGASEVSIMIKGGHGRIGVLLDGKMIQVPVDVMKEI